MIASFVRSPACLEHRRRDQRRRVRRQHRQLQPAEFRDGLPILLQFSDLVAMALKPVDQPRAVELKASAASANISYGSPRREHASRCRR